jgi:nucleotide-binding universal stress UspA family protein
MRTHQHVVIAYDFSQSSMSALERAIDVAARAPHNVLHFVCVIEPHTAIPAIPTDGKVDAAYATQVQEALFTEVELQLALAHAEVKIDFFVHARIGKPAEEVLELAHEIGADLIIVGSKGLRGLERLIVGSVSEQIVRAAGCTVEVARPKAYKDIELLTMTEVEPDHHPYIPPHRYRYEDHRVDLRPTDWPLY